MEKIALLFPGQGSQEVNMGRDLAEAQADIMALWKKAEKISGIDLRGIYWDGDAQAMANTRNLQPALTVVNISLWMQLAGKITPACCAGHSLGEFSALAAAEALSVEDTLATVSLRGQLMADADPAGNGTMAAALKTSLADLEKIVAQTAQATGEMLLIANYNTPGQFVLSGTRNAIEAAALAIKEHKGRCIPLPVSGAFHSPLMADASKELTAAMAKLCWNTPKFPVFCNVTGESVSEGAALQEATGKQMTSSVQWITTITNQYTSGIRHYVEVGPKGVLGKMLGQILKPVADSNEWTGSNVATLEHVEAFTAPSAQQ